MFRKRISKSFDLLIFVILMSLFAVNCKSTPKEETTEETSTETTSQSPKTSENLQEGTQTETERKITDEQFLEAQELIERAKNAEADIYDPENYQGAIDDLQKARDLNETDSKQAFDYLAKSREQSQKAFYNAYKKRALLKREEAEKLLQQIADSKIDVTMNEDYQQAKTLFQEGDTAIDEDNYKFAYTKFYDAVELLQTVMGQTNQEKEEFESKIEYVKGLIDEAKRLGAEEYAPDELELAENHLSSGMEIFARSGIKDAEEDIDLAEDYAKQSIAKTQAALLAIKKEKARQAIIEAGKKIEEASKKTIINEQGESESQDQYNFEFDEDKEENLNNASDNVTSYQDVLNKAIEYVEKAKEAYRNEDYDMAIRYAELARKIADSYTSTGIKTTYQVRLIPDRRDCLWRISEYTQIYGNPFYWPLIWKANKKKILNPDLIYPGQVFVIPEID